MSAYYYVAASLPLLLDADQKPPMASSELLEFCRRFLSDADFDDLSGCDLNPEESRGGGFSDRYREWERSLRNHLLTLRAQEQGVEDEPFRRESPPVFGTRRIAQEAMNCSTPLEAEIYLDNERWSYVDDLANGHFFDMEFLQGYRLKLLLQERRSLFEEEKGFAAYKQIYSRVLEASGEMQE